MTNKEIPPILSDFNEEELKESSSLIPLNSAQQWQDITNSLVERLEKEDLPEKVIKVTEYLVCGWPLYKTAKKVGTTTTTIRKWLKKYPIMALAIAEGRKALHLWRLSQLEQQFVSAMEITQELFDAPEGEWVEFYDDSGGVTREWKPTNHKLLAAKATHARFIMNLFAGKKLKIDIQKPEDEKPPLKAGKDALDYLIQGISEKIDENTKEPIETVVRIVDTTSGEDIPIVDEEGEPFHGELGEMDVNEEGALCHICGKRTKHMRQHIGGAHRMKVMDYEVTFMLSKGALKRAESKS